MTADEFRLLAISKVLDGIGAVDIHALACALNGGDEPLDEHYLQAVREALDVIVRAEFGDVFPMNKEQQ